MTTPTGLKTTIGDLLDRQAEQFGDNDALIHVDWDVRYTYREFRAECDRVARGLMALGINKGDHVGIWDHQLPGVGGGPVRRRQDRRRAGHGKPGLPHP